MTEHSIALTDKQREIMDIILKATDEGRDVTAPYVRERLSYGANVSYQAVLYSLNLLVQHGVLVKEYPGGVKRVGGVTYFRPTMRAYELFR